jgi:hypothetical protein
MSAVNEIPLIYEMAPESTWSTSMGAMNMMNNVPGGLALLLTGVFKQRLGLGMIFTSIRLFRLFEKGCRSRNRQSGGGGRRFGKIDHD